MSGLAEVVLDPFPDRATDWPVWPSFLPDGDHFLFTNQDGLTASTGVYVGSISSREIAPVGGSGTKTAVTDLFASIRIESGFVTPCRSPLHPAKT